MLDLIAAVVREEFPDAHAIIVAGLTPGNRQATARLRSVEAGGIETLADAALDPADPRAAALERIRHPSNPAWSTWRARATGPRRERG